MGAEIQTYQNAAAACASAVREVERIVGIVERGRQALAHWRSTMITNSAGEFPPRIAMGKGPTLRIDAKQWPTGQNIADALRAYHRCRDQLRAAYEAIPVGDRATVTPPQADER